MRGRGYHREKSAIDHEACLSHSHSFKITLSNNRTEKEAVEHLRVHDPRVVAPDRDGRRAIMEYFAIPKHLGRAFDLIRLPDGVMAHSVVPDQVISDIELIEVKSTKKLLRHLPYGFFFGATANEFELAERLEGRFKFCFVCLHPDAFGISYVSLAELTPLIRTKRVQYQVNLISSGSKRRADEEPPRGQVSRD